MIHFLQISDTHLQLEQKTVYNVDVVKNFEQILEAVKIEHQHCPIDSLIITGDLCFKHGEKKVYQYIKKKIDDLNIPYHIISGNHDNNLMIAETFNLKLSRELSLFFQKTIKRKSFIFLDTSNDSLSREQQYFLKEQSQYQSPVFVFMHHPPTYCAMPFMDNHYRLRNIEEVQECLKTIDKNLYIFAGHYHTDKAISINNKIHIFLCPSTFCQLSTHSETLKIENYRIGYRNIIIENNNKIITHAKYL